MRLLIPPLLRDRAIRDYYSAKLLTGLLAGGTVVFFARVLGSVGYAELTLVLLAAQMFGVLSGGWAGQSSLRFSGRRPVMRTRSLSLTLLLAIVPSLAAYWFVLRGGLLGEASPSEGALVFGLVMLVAFTFDGVAKADLQTHLLSRQWSRWELVRIGLPLLLVILASLFGEVSVLEVLCYVALGTGLSWVGSTYSLRTVSFEGVLAVGESLRFGMPMTLWAALAYVYGFGDRYLIAGTIGLEAAGAYSAAYDFVSKGATLVLFPLTMATHPTIMRLADSGSSAEARSLMGKVLRLQTSFGLVLVTGVCVLWIPARSILNTPGISWVTAGLVALATVLMQVALVAHKSLEAAGKTGTMLALMSFSVALNIVGNILLIPVYGLSGAAAMTAIAAGSYLLLVVRASQLGRSG